MKKFLCTFFLCILTTAILTVSAHAVEDIIKVGLCFGDAALDVVCLDNTQNYGYNLGWFDEKTREFHPLAHVEEKRLAIKADSCGMVVSAADSGLILYQFDGSSGRDLGIVPDGKDGKAQTWFQNARWYGGFECRRGNEGRIEVINVVDVEDYVKGVLPYEMSPEWPLEALKAQAVCARTYAHLTSKHYANSHFDVCNTTDCQVYRGINLSSALTNQAVEETAGITAMYDGNYAETYYYSANGGASESAENVWGDARPYLTGKADPYEALTDIPDYHYTIHYTYGQLTQRLRENGYAIGTVIAAFVSQTTPTGNVAEITFRDAAGKTVTLKRADCRWTLDTKSMRFTIEGGGGPVDLRVNPTGETVSSSGEVFAISGKGQRSLVDGGDGYVITAAGVSALAENAVNGSGDGVTISGTGWGHGIGMSQYGAKAMAEQGCSFEDILSFYFTGITLQQAG